MRLAVDAVEFDLDSIPNPAQVGFSFDQLLTCRFFDTWPAKVPAATRAPPIIIYTNKWAEWNCRDEHDEVNESLEWGQNTGLADESDGGAKSSPKNWTPLYYTFLIGIGAMNVWSQSSSL